MCCAVCLCFFFFNDTATTEIYTLSLHDALPIWGAAGSRECRRWSSRGRYADRTIRTSPSFPRTQNKCWPTSSRSRVKRSEEHTSELQSRQYLVCRLLLEKKNSTFAT